MSTEIALLGQGLASFAELPKDATRQAVEVTKLDLSFNDLVDPLWEHLKPFAALETLILDNNGIVSIAGLPPLPQLQTLWMNNNHLSNIEEVLGVLVQQCPKLTYLSMLNNPCTPNELNGSGPHQYARHRLYVRYRMPSLVYLDAVQFTNKEKADARGKGKFMRTVSVDDVDNSDSSSQASEDVGAVASSKNSVDGDSAAEPAASGPRSNYYKVDSQREGKHTTHFGQQRHFYSGKTSEGNRFIRDNVL